MKRIFTINVLVLFFISLPSVLFASGVIQGVVSDSSTGETLVGANVLIVGTSIGAATNLEGKYIIEPVPPGHYKIKCSYIGYVAVEKEITVTDKRTTVLNFKLKYSVLQGKEIVVTGQALGQAAAINQQITSDKIENVISEQKIKELPDANAAEALGRLPGVSVIRSGGEATQIMLRGLSENLTTVTVDGVKLSPTDPDSRGIDLSTISQGSLSGIVLSKAITSDMDGEAIAGNVNLVTKTAPKIREISVKAYGSYNGLDKTYDQYNFQGQYGERFFNDLLGVQLFANIEKRDRSSENYGVSYDFFNNRKTHLIQNFTIAYTPELRKRRGARVLLDFRTPDNGVLKLNTEYYRTERRFSIISRNYPADGGDVGYDFTGEDVNTDIKSIALHGDNNILGWHADWNFSYSESGSETPYNNVMHLGENNVSVNGQVVAGMYFVPIKDRTGTNYENLVPYAVNNFNYAYFNRTEARTSSNLDFEKTFFLNLSKNYNLLDLSGVVKFGVKYRSKYHRRNATLTQARYYLGTGFYSSVLNADGSISPKDFAKYGFQNMQMSHGLILLSNFLSGTTRNVFNKYLLYPMFDPNRARAWWDMNINGINPSTHIQEYVPDHSEDGTNYNLTENVSAGYLMNTLNIGSYATLITGLRIEADNNTYNALYSPYVLTEWSTFYDTTAHHTEAILLPNVQMILKPTDYMNIRLAAYKGLERPDFNYRLPTYILRGNSGGALNENNILEVGNPNLKNAVAWNFEVNLQLFNNDIGLFSISAFYKDIKNQVHQIYQEKISNNSIADSLGIKFVDNIKPFSGAPYYLTYPYNSSKPTRVWGFEVEHQANFRWLPGLLSNIVLSYNLSIIRTETYTPTITFRQDTVQLPGLPFPTVRSSIVYYEDKVRIANSPDLFGNISLGYDIGGFSGRISYFYQGLYYNNYSSDKLSNVIQKKFGRVDLSLKQKITDNLSVGLDVNNLTNTKEGTYLEDAIYHYRLDTGGSRYGTSGDIWLKVAL